MERSSGILLHISSLPSRYGIGTLGRQAYNFVDFLKKAEQKIWQILPVGPTGYGDSPYQSFSVFAGNPYFIDPDMLLEEGLLTEADLAEYGPEDESGNVDYGMLFEKRLPLLRKAFIRGFDSSCISYQNFVKDNAVWLYDYSFFAAIKSHLNHIPLSEWPEDLKLREACAMHKYGVMLEDEINFQRYLQYLFFRQYSLLKAYAAKKGILIFGDMPFYPSPDSSDVWSWPQIFQLDKRTAALRAVAGVPPDYFSKDGQLWGNPLYDWNQLKKEDYRWFLLRFAQLGNLYNIVRIDHFRGLHSYFSIPAGDKTARNGHWEKGPGLEFTGLLSRLFPDLTIIAEDLGDLDADVKQFVKDSGFAGMNVLQFAFDAKDSPYLPHNHRKYSVTYTGTHDNDTLKGFFSGSGKNVSLAREYLNLKDRNTEIFDTIRAGMASVSELFIAPLQDYLELGSSSRMNTPSTTYGNWQYRVDKDVLDEKLAKKIADLTLLFCR